MLCNPPYTKLKSPKEKAKQKPLSSWLNVLLERTQESVLLCGGLVGTVTELRGGIDPFEVDLLQCLLEVWTNMDLRRVMTRFLTPGTEPLRMTKSFLTSPYLTKPPIGVICFLETSNSVAALPSSSPFPIR